LLARNADARPAAIAQTATLCSFYPKVPYAVAPLPAPRTKINPLLSSCVRIMAEVTTAITAASTPISPKVSISATS
jgi:hypothetical protein